MGTKVCDENGCRSRTRARMGAGVGAMRATARTGTAAGRRLSSMAAGERRPSSGRRVGITWPKGANASAVRRRAVSRMA